MFDRINWDPKIQIEYAEALHCPLAMRKAQGAEPAAAPAEKTKENKYGKTKGGVGVTGIAMQLSGGPGLDALLRRLAGYKRAITKAAGRDGGRSIQVWRKLLSVALARYTAATILSATGHKAWREVSCPVSFLLPLGPNHSL